jgi:uncharacterized protein YndB with AHSA1/START domain
MTMKTHVTAEPGMTHVILTRDFDAPRESVFKAYTDPALIARWWGQAGGTTVVDKLEVKPGGMWRFVQRDDQGNAYAFFGFFHQIAPPERLVYTFEFEGMPGHILMETIILEEHEGKTRMTDISSFQSVADRDGMLQAGMVEGGNESLDQLEQLLGSM